MLRWDEQMQPGFVHFKLLPRGLVTCRDAIFRPIGD